MWNVAQTELDFKLDYKFNPVLTIYHMQARQIHRNKNAPETSF